MKNEFENEHEIQIVYHLYVNDVYRFIVSFTKSQEVAEDLTQEVFIRLCKALKTFKGQAELKTYVFSIARHVVFDHYRKRKRRARIQEYLLKALTFPQKTTEEIVEQRESLSEVYVALNQLKPKFKMVVILRGLQEFSIKETAEIMGCTESNVKVLYHRGIKQLRARMESGKNEESG
ncbi:RNA polymerase sigma factor [Alkalihalobacillus sp. LMS39]|uniref:RNA polymerase sigma factor n=1 Tax=Alkalihalobacillus sp. LMS39 TaxID=2924032 RepID=UPI001FB329B1|nr:RNA polymerase sigma factor [Alkalihalobacillus sp. LMS39]UOE95810.1 RNA polymerase sigma factor [Alkalihalobacillus sp. LMS39]